MFGADTGVKYDLCIKIMLVSESLDSGYRGGGGDRASRP